jgi:hypothetical protein
MAFAQVARVRRFEHRRSLRGQRVEAGQRSHREDDRIAWRERVSARRALLLEQPDADPRSAQPDLEQLRPFLGRERAA